MSGDKEGVKELIRAREETRGQVRRYGKGVE